MFRAEGGIRLAVPLSTAVERRRLSSIESGEPYSGLGSYNDDREHLPCIVTYLPKDCCALLCRRRFSLMLGDGVGKERKKERQRAEMRREGRNDWIRLD